MIKVSGTIGTMGRKHKSLSGQVRAAVDASGLSRYAICKATGINQAAMSRFMTGKGGLSMAALDRLAKCIGLEVKLKAKHRKGR